MSNPKEIKKRILSIESVIKTTEAMKMISIFKLRTSKKLLLHNQKYLEYIKQLFENFLFSCLERKKDFHKKNLFFSSSLNKRKKLFIIITSDRGLCGSFNSSIFENIHNIVKKNSYINNDCLFFPIGKKGFHFLLKQKYHMYIYDQKKKKSRLNNYSYKEIYLFVKRLIKDFLSKKITSVYIVYNHLKNSLFQKTNIEKLLPIYISNNIHQKKTLKNLYQFSILEPTIKEIIEYIIPKFISARLFNNLLESHTSEHTLRMISMHKATENAYDLKNHLMLNYNKERQTSITNEILEIISGLEALNQN
ncbi:ATP synthase F1 subunit gamma [Blattabacterium cuenoti]|uniref:ATP synthase F1 subunit gamma n=1 Tax=Blattabacterium cuenoti TaxID=1653831 RepID=UPI00163BCEA8|nr:ATP synthase F1 subunit gamma [Blattabacterium cuenoti]